MSAIPCPKLTAPDPATRTRRMEPLAVDAKVLAAMLGLSVRTIRLMDAGGKLPRPAKLNCRAVRWVLDGPNGVRAWLEAGAPPREQFEAIQRNGRPGT